jgi:hypothetical protein
MRLVDNNDPEQRPSPSVTEMLFGPKDAAEVRRKRASKHYAKIARQAKRQIAIDDFFNRPRFAYVDMIAVAIASAVLAMGVVVFFIR